MILKPTKVLKCIKVSYKHNMPPTCLGHSCGHPQGGGISMQPTFVIHLPDVCCLMFVGPCIVVITEE